MPRKKLKQTEAFRNAKLFLKRLIGKEPWLGVDVRVAVDRSDDWAYYAKPLNSDSVVYSLGVGCDIAFDTELIRRFGANVYAFDPTPSTAEWLEDRETPAQFHYFPWAIAGTDHTMRMVPRVNRKGKRSEIMFHQIDGDAPHRDDEIEVAAKSLGTICRDFDHDEIAVLKMDIEGAEYEVLDNIFATAIRPTQILVEFHHRHPGRDKSMTTDAIRRLRESGYAIFAISSTGREFSFIRQDAL